ncbi:MAG: sporulation protein YunB [Clostridia bacterium]|nr:sporulation protein YunB [Clostridia bacterium]
MKHNKLFRVSLALIIIFAIVSIAFIIIFDRSFSYQLEQYSKREVVNTINREVNGIILEELTSSDLSYNKIVTVERDSIGKASYVKADMLVVNKLKNILDMRIADICECRNAFEASIPVGNLVGGGLMYGKGFDVVVKFKPIGEASTKMTGKLVDSGINQTIYRISFETKINAAVVFPFRYIEVPIRIETVVSETVIIGEVPESFTYFNMEGEMTGDELMGYVQDFKADKSE